MSGDRRLVITIGSLGELAKKIVEIEARVIEAPRNRQLVLELASLRSLVEQWPVIDTAKMDTLCLAMEYEVMKYKAVEKHIEQLLANETERFNTGSTWFEKLVRDMFSHRDNIKKIMAELNKLSGGVGKASALSDYSDVDIQVAGQETV